MFGTLLRRFRRKAWLTALVLGAVAGLVPSARASDLRLVNLDLPLADLDRHEYHVDINYFAFYSSSPTGRLSESECDEDGTPRVSEEDQYASWLFREAIQGPVGGTPYWPRAKWLVFEVFFGAEESVLNNIKRNIATSKVRPFTAQLSGELIDEKERDVAISLNPDGVSFRLAIRTNSRRVGGPFTRRLSFRIANQRSKVFWRLRPLGIQIVSVGFPYTVRDRAEIAYQLRDLGPEMEARARLTEYGGFECFSEADETTQDRIRMEVWEKYFAKSFDLNVPRDPETIRQTQESDDEAEEAARQKEEAVTQAKIGGAVAHEKARADAAEAELAKLRQQRTDHQPVATASVTTTVNVVLTGTILSGMALHIVSEAGVEVLSVACQASSLVTLPVGKYFCRISYKKQLMDVVEIDPVTHQNVVETTGRPKCKMMTVPCTEPYVINVVVKKGGAGR